MSLQPSLSLGLSRQDYWHGLPCPPPGHLPNPEIELTYLMSPALAGRLFTTTPTWEALFFHFIEVSVQFSPSCVRFFATPWTAACQASLSFTDSWSLFKLKSIESVMSSNHLIRCCPLLLPSIFPSIRVFSNESALHIR